MFALVVQSEGGLLMCFVESDPYRNRLPELIDRKDEIEREMKEIEDEEALLHEFEKLLTPKELNVFHMYFFKDKSQAEIGLMMKISQQAVSGYIKKLNFKWINPFRERN